jgi:hypothetical protein
MMKESTRTICCKQTANSVLSIPLASRHLAGGASGAAAWKIISSWYIVAKHDHAINLDLERFFAKRMKATITELDSSDVQFTSQPAEVLKMIEDVS